MPFDVQALLHNKPALIGLGVAGAAGLYVLIKRKQTTGSSTSGAGVAGGQTPYTVPSSYPDTTSTDLVQQWGQFSQNLQADLAKDFPNAGAPNGGSGSVLPSNLPATSNVIQGWPVLDYLGKINAGYSSYLTPTDLLKLNPGLSFTGPSNNPFFTQTQTINL